MQLRVGEDVVTFCGKCKQRTFHVVFAMEGPKVKRVQCKICMSYHNYHPDPEAPGSEPTQGGVAARRRRNGEEVVTPASAAGRPSPETVEKAPRATPSRAASPRPAAGRSRQPETPDWSTLWNEAMKGKDPESMVEYRPSSSFPEGGLVNHPSFGVGVVTRVSPEKKMQVLFREGPRTLVCGRA